MPVFQLNNLPKEKRIQMIGEFYDTIDSLKDRIEIRSFFRSLLTPEEIATLMRRIEIAVFLAAGYSYADISRILGVGNNKISSVHKALEQDDNGYKVVVNRLIENRKKRLKKMKKEERDAMRPNALVKKKYAGVFLLDNLLDAAIEKLEENDEELKEEAILNTPSAIIFRKK